MVGRQQNRQRRVALYCRPSATDPDCIAQQRDLVAVARRRGDLIVGVFSEPSAAAAAAGDGEAAAPSITRRERVLDLARAGAIDAIFVTELARWSPIPADLVETVRGLAPCRVQLVALNGFRLELNTPAGIAIAQALVLLARHERELVAEHVRAGLAMARARGAVLGRRPGQRPKADRLAPKVLAMTEEGRSYCVIADQLGISKNTVAGIVQRHSADRPDAPLDQSSLELEVIDPI